MTNSHSLFSVKKRKRRLNDNNELGLTFSESFVHFKDVKCFDNFEIQVHGLTLDLEIPARLRRKYYELCKSQKNFLHKNLRKGLNRKLAARVISKTIKIADAIRAAKLSTNTSHLEGYDKTLKEYEEKGMAVGFLRARIDKLTGLSRELQDVVKSLRNELRDAEDKYRVVKAELTGAAMSIRKIVDEILGLEAKNEKPGVRFTDIAGVPW
ncbi:B3 domain-containing protein os01g0234100 [Phtheirospermum japonicum]|uniref:B3 domain-containing protein os01g0234100 n=1 Tax=Phtheirospermum japonicum TaxID=374723 RepID=A0A830D135_9LAMI|nr:B3 domain-containing protein os01g0234100 [Phtheirospermum japonicum]